MNVVSRVCFRFGLAAIAVALIAPAPPIALAADHPLYVLDKTLPLGGVGNWDYLSYDSVAGRLFVSRATRVMVVDPQTGRVTGEIPDTLGVHGIALAQDLGRGYTSNGRDNSVTVFDLKTLKTITKIPIAGKNPDAILYEPVTKRIFTFDGGSLDATAIDATTNSVVGTIPLGGRPEFAVADGNGMLFDNLEDKNQIKQIDARKLTVTGTFSLSPCDGPTGLAMDQAHRRLFSGCANKIMAVVDAESGKLVAMPIIGAGVDAVAFDPGTSTIFSSNGDDGTLSVLHEDDPNTYSAVETATTRKYAKTMAITPDATKVYLVAADVTLTPAAPGATRPTRTQVPDTFALLVVDRK